MMAVEPKRHREGQEGSNAQGYWTEHLIPDIEVVMGVAAALRTQDAIVRVLCWKLGHGNAETRSDLHALEDEVNSETILLSPLRQVGPEVILLAHVLFSPLQSDLIPPGIGLDP